MTTIKESRDLHGLVINSPTIQRNQMPPPPHPAQGRPVVGKVKGQINWYFRYVWNSIYSYHAIKYRVYYIINIIYINV